MIEVEGEDPKFKYVPFKNMSTNDALKFRSLDNLIPSEHLYKPKTAVTKFGDPIKSTFEIDYSQVTNPTTNPTTNASKFNSNE